jgi:CcmD family protein
MNRNTTRKAGLIISAAVLALALGASRAHAAGAAPARPSTAPAAQADVETSSATLRRVMWVVLAAWTALGVYLFTIDRKVTRLEKRVRGE